MHFTFNSTSWNEHLSYQRKERSSERRGKKKREREKISNSRKDDFFVALLMEKNKLKQ